MSTVKITTFYKFIPIDPEKLETYRKLVHRHCDANKIKGTILLGIEGVNATICGYTQNLDQTIDFLQNLEWLGEFQVKHSYADFFPFEKMKVKIREEIVVIGSPETNSREHTGQHIAPENWNDFIRRDDVMLIDTRNDFEYQLGTFENAINPNTETFREFPEYIEKHVRPEYEKGKKIAMFCTGGIRCEKASAFMKENGFDEIYQLDGGILNYFDKVDEQDSSWHGKCFVFDDRISVDQNLQPNGTLEDLDRVGKS